MPKVDDEKYFTKFCWDNEISTECACYHPVFVAKCRDLGECELAIGRMLLTARKRGQDGAPTGVKRVRDPDYGTSALRHIIHSTFMATHGGVARDEFLLDPKRYIAIIAGEYWQDIPCDLEYKYHAYYVARLHIKLDKELFDPKKLGGTRDGNCTYLTEAERGFLEYSSTPFRQQTQGTYPPSLLVLPADFVSKWNWEYRVHRLEPDQVFHESVLHAGILDRYGHVAVAGRAARTHKHYGKKSRG